MKTRKRTERDVFAEAAQRAVRRAGWDPQTDLEIVRPDSLTRLQTVAHGCQPPGTVRLVQSRTFTQEITQTLNEMGSADEGKVMDAVADVVFSQVFLQVGRFQVCPYSAKAHEELREACADGMRSAGATTHEIHQFQSFMTSLFIASIITGVYAIEGPDPVAFRRGWLLDRLNSFWAVEHTLPPHAAVYINVQLRLWACEDDLSHRVQSWFPVPFDALRFETDRGTAILLDTFDFVDAGDRGIAWSDEHTRDLIIDELKYKWRDWPIKAFQFAEMLSPYMVSDLGGRRPPPPPVSSCGPDRRGERPSEGARQRRAAVHIEPARNDPVSVDQEGWPRNWLPDAPLELLSRDLVPTPALRRHVVFGRHCRGRYPPENHLSFEILDALYRIGVTDVRIKFDPVRKPAAAMDIAHLAREEASTQLLSFNQIDWAGTRIKPDGELQFYEKRLPISWQSPARVETKGIPDLLLVVDSSGSMRWDPEDGHGPYDSLLRAVYSVFHFLEDGQKAQCMRFAAVNFSDATLTTSWHSYRALNEVKKLLFRHQRGGTRLDCAKLRQLAEAGSNRFLCLMVTDSQIANPADVVSTIQEMTDLGHGFVLIQIGQAVPMTLEVQSAGHAVHVITDHRQMEGLCLDYARRTWGR